MSSAKLPANLTAGLQHVMRAAVRNRRGVLRAEGAYTRYRSWRQLHAVGPEVKNLVFGRSIPVYNHGILHLALNILQAGD